MPGYVRNRGKTTAGKTKWQARWRHPQDARKQVEKQGFDTKKRAEAWIEQQDADAWAGLWVDPHDSDRRFSEVVESWRETWMNLEPKTRAGYDNILVQRVLPVFGDRRIGQIDHDEVQQFINRIKDGADRPGRLHNVPRAPNTVHRVYTVLRGVFVHAERRSYIRANPCAHVTLPSKRKGRPRMLFLEPAEVRAVAEAVPEHYRVAVYVAAWTGLRAGELWALRRDDVDPLRGRLRVDESLRELNGESVAAGDRGLSFGPPKSEASRRTFTLPAPDSEALGGSLGPAPSRRRWPGGPDLHDALGPARPARPVLQPGVQARRTQRTPQVQARPALARPAAHGGFAVVGGRALAARREGAAGPRGHQDHDQHLRSPAALGGRGAGRRAESPVRR
jgi:integrase